MRDSDRHQTGICRRQLVWLTLALLIVTLLPGSGVKATTPPGPALPVSDRYLVLYAAGVSLPEGRAAIAAAGGLVVHENAAVGLATVEPIRRDGRFVHAVAQQPALFGATLNLPVGRIAASELPAHPLPVVAKEIEPGTLPGWQTNDDPAAPPRPEPLANLQWDMRLIGATADGAQARQSGDRRVLVGVIDGGVDGSHPDIAPNFSLPLSRNFVTDIPDLDGPCATPTCIDPPDVDGNGHGTHVAGTIAAAANGLGVAGVAPNVTIVSLRAGQRSGFFLVGPTVDALTYAGDIGINVANMSFYIDPWLYNCPNNPADNPEAQQAQRTVIEATQRALDYARARGVTLVAAAGNESADLDNVTVDTSSPNFPKGAAYRRTVDRSCLTMPADGAGVISVTSVGPSGRKAFYSNYGQNHADIAAPGGDSLDYFGTSQYQPVTNRVLSSYPRVLLQQAGEVDAQGNVTPRGRYVVRDCQQGVCAYYRYLEGTSMAAPHVTGVVALIISEYGATSRRHPDGLSLPPARAERILLNTALPQTCPAQNPQTYSGGPREATARCEGSPEHTNFFGVGIVDARAAVTAPTRP